MPGLTTMIGGVVATEGGRFLAKGLLDSVVAKVKKPFLVPEKEKALHRCLQDALSAALNALHLPPGFDEPVLNEAKKWCQLPEVHLELAGLLRSTPEMPDRDSLWLAWQGVSTSLNEQQFGTFLVKFVSEFTECAGADSGLAPLLGIQGLHTIARELREGLGAVAQHALRTAEATERIAEQIPKLVQLVERQTSLLEIREELPRSGSTLGLGQAAVVYGYIMARLGTESDGEWEKLLQPLRTLLLTSSSEDALREREAQYRRGLAASWGRLDYGSSAGKRIAVNLGDVYVDPQVVRHVPTSADTFDPQERRILIEEDAPVSAWGVVPRRLRLTLPDLENVERRSLSSVLDDSDVSSFVLLGDPGSGKSTALRRYASLEMEHPSGLLPVLAPLAAYDAHLRQGGGGSLLNFLGIYFDTYKNQPGLGPLFSRRLEEGKLLLMLDGLDEVLQSTTRSHVAQQVSDLTNRAAATGSRVILTSRTIGYPGLSTVVSEYSLLPFGMTEISTFVNRFSQAVAAALYPDPKGDEQTREAARAERDLMADIRAMPDVRELASNPLLLTQIALLRRDVGVLPEGRAELYDRFLKKLLRDWSYQRNQGAARHNSEYTVGQTNTLRAMSDLALFLHKNRANGTAHTDEVIDVLSQSLHSNEHDGDARSAAQHLLREVREQAGILIERGHDVFGFIHLTFEEYLAGRALARMSTSQRTDLLHQHLHDPRWREPFLLTVGWLSQVDRDKDVAALIQEVLDAKSEDEELLHRDLFLAADMAVEAGTSLTKLRANLSNRLSALCSGGPKHIPALRWAAVGRLGRLARAGCSEARRLLLAELPQLVADGVAGALVPVLTAPKCLELRQWLRDKVAEGDFQAARLLVATLAMDSEDLELLRKAPDLPHKDPHVGFFLWMDIAHQIPHNRDVRAAVLEAMRADTKHSPLPPAQALRNDLELCKEMLRYWAKNGSHQNEPLAQSLGKELRKQGVEAEWVLEAVRSNGPGSGIVYIPAVVVPVLEAYADHPSVREYLWSIARDAEGRPVQPALHVLARTSSATEAERIVSFLDSNSNHSRQILLQALSQLPAGHPWPKSFVLDRLRSLDAQEVRAAAGVVGQLGTTSEVIRTFEEHGNTVREVLAPLLLKRLPEVEAHRLLKLGVAEQKTDHLSRTWVWPVWIQLYERAEWARERFAAAIQRGEPEPAALLLRSGLGDGELRAKAFGLLATQHPLWYEYATPDDVVNLVRKMPGEALSWWTTLAGGMTGYNPEEGFFSKTYAARTGLGDALFTAGLGEDLSTVLASMTKGHIPERQQSHIFGVLVADRYSDANEEEKQLVNQLWANNGPWWFCGTPNPQVPSVSTVLIEAIHTCDSKWFPWATVALSSEILADEDLLKKIVLFSSESEKPNCLIATINLLRHDPADASDVRELTSQFLNHPSPQVRSAAIDNIAEWEPSSTLVDSLRLSLADPTLVVRQAAATTLACWQYLSSPKMLDWLGAGNLGVNYQNSPSVERSFQYRKTMARVLADRMTAEPQVESALKERLGHPEWTVRQGAALALLFANPDPSEELVALLQKAGEDRSGSESWGGRTACAQALLGIEDAEGRAAATQTLADGLSFCTAPWQESDAGSMVRSRCANILKDAPAKDLDTIAALRRATAKDRQPYVRSAAWEALNKHLSSDG